MKSNIKPVWLIAASVAVALFVVIMAWHTFASPVSYSNTPHSKAAFRKNDFKAQWNRKSGE